MKMGYEKQKMKCTFAALLCSGYTHCEQSNDLTHEKEERQRLSSKLGKRRTILI
jgi:hypothetical protein